jgi:two-component system phosphate regulon sensor histidine kinase PhoR
MPHGSVTTPTICNDGALSGLLDAMPELLLYADTEGVVQAVSGKIDDFFGIKPGELAGKPINDFAEQIGRCFSEFMTYHEIIGYPLHDGEHEFLRDIEIAKPKHRYLQVTSSPVASGGKTVGRLWLMRDVTSDREITDLKIQYGGARGADELKSKFLTVISHQMRTPLNSVRWNMELLLSGDFGAGLSAEGMDVLKEVYKAVVNSISIVDDMLLAVDIEQRTLRLDKAEANLGDVVTKVVHDFERTAALKAVSLTLAELPKDLPRLFIDGGKIETVLNRIIDNALRYTPKDGSVKVTVRTTPKEVVVDVSDTGVGIPAKEHPRVFGRFYRAKEAIGLHPNASGLGLYISKFIVDAHEGTINFRSEEGKGTTFTVTLPRRAPA